MNQMASAATRWSTLGAVLSALALATAWPASARPEPPRGVIIVVVDALRADHLGCYGYPRATSPNIDRLAADGVRFANAVAAAPWTLPSLGTLWTSLYPSVHGATRRSNEVEITRDPSHFHPVRKLDQSRTTLAEVLQANGFATAAFVDGAYTGRTFGMAQGFSLFVEDEVSSVGLNVDALFNWLHDVDGHPFFAWVHAIEVHSPYTPKGIPPDIQRRSDAAAVRYRATRPEEDARFLGVDFDPGYSGEVDGSLPSLGKLRSAARLPSAADLRHLNALYDRGIAYTDYWIGKLVDGLKQRGLYDQTVLIVTADHGDELFDHGGLEHAQTFYEETMRVPLIMRVPGAPHARVVAQQVGLIDVMPTLLDLLAVPHSLFLQGVSLVPLLTDGTSLPERFLFGEAAMSLWRKAVRSDSFKYLEEKRKRELYDLRSDPGERHNLCSAEPSQCEEFAARVEHWRSDMAATKERLQLPATHDAAIDEQTAERLRALGYK